MSRRLARALCELAILMLPASRRRWGEAMRAELSYIDDGVSALDHAGGCLVAAVRARVADLDSRFAAGIGLIALVSAAFGIFHIACASRGIDVLLGAPDGFLNAMVASGRASPELIARYQEARPVVVCCLLALGFAHLAATCFLLRRDWQRFLLMWCCALIIAIVAVAIQLSVVWSADGLPSEFAALIVQAVALPMLLLWSNGRHRLNRRPE